MNFLRKLPLFFAAFAFTLVSWGAGSLVSGWLSINNPTATGTLTVPNLALSTGFNLGGGFSVGSTAGIVLNNTGYFGAAGGNATGGPRATFCYLVDSVWEVGTTACGTGGSLEGAGFMSAGTKFTEAGCTTSATAGGATAGTFTLSQNNCTAVITMNGATGLTAPTGWSCQAHDRTLTTLLLGGESSSTTTTASIPIPVTAGATDVISFSCVGY